MIAAGTANRILIDDLEHKKAYTCKYNRDCSTCRMAIGIGDDYYYIGDEEVCDQCRLDLIEYLEEL